MRIRIVSGSGATRSEPNLTVKLLAAALSVSPILCAVAVIVCHNPDISY